MPRKHGKKPANDNLRLLFNISAKQKKRALDPPVDNNVIDVLHGIKVSDPFRPLENLDAPETLTWEQRENKVFDDFVRPAHDIEEKTIRFLEDAAPQGMRETLATRYGDKYIVSRKEKDAKRWSLYIKDVPDYDAPARLLIDPMQIDPSGKTNLVLTSFTRDGKTMAYALSVSGSDKTTLRFMDVETGKDFGPVYDDFRSGVLWDRDGQGFHYSHLNETKTREVCYHKMGTPIEDDQIVYTPVTAETGASYSRVLKDLKDETGAYEFISVGNTEPDKNALLARKIGSGDDFREIFPHKEGTLGPIHEINGKIYAVTSLGAPNEKLVCFDVNDPSPDKWQTILPEDRQDSLTSAYIWQNKIFATYSHDTADVVKVFDLDGKHLHDVPLPALSVGGLSNMRMEETTCYASYSSFQESGDIYKYDSETNQFSLYRKSTVPIDLKDCIVERMHATSKDGTKVPMTVIRHPDTKLDGTAAALLYGYGGFGIPLRPGFSSGIAEWVRAGGIYVMANLRGGGEYGQAWYDAGRKENKQNVFDDFAACAEHLIENDYTSNKRIAIQGGSNGGLLTLATGLQHPELFGAIVSEVPVTDMFRFHLGSYYGYGWKSDYGDPDVTADFNVAAKYSPLHNVKKGFRHPPILIKTDAHDDRVLPWHGFKMAAMLQSREDKRSLTLLKVRADGGHSAGMTEAQARQDVASVRAFLNRTIGPVNQKTFKAQMKKPRKPKTKQQKKHGR